MDASELKKLRERMGRAELLEKQIAEISKGKNYLEDRSLVLNVSMEEKGDAFDISGHDLVCQQVRVALINVWEAKLTKLMAELKAL